MKIYIAKTLFSGGTIGKDPNARYVAVPGGQNFPTKSNFAKEKKFKVIHEEQFMIIENWHKANAIRTFDDMNGRGQYKLAYFEWKPFKENADKDFAVNIDVKARLAEDFFKKYPELRKR